MSVLLLNDGGDELLINDSGDNLLLEDFAGQVPPYVNVTIR